MAAFSDTHSTVKASDSTDEVELHLNLDMIEDRCTEQCDRHSGRIVKYYCRDHACLGCSVCMEMNHRQCEDVDNINELVGSKLISQVYTQLLSDIRTLRNNCEQIEQFTNKYKDVANSICSGVKTAVQNLREGVNRALDRMEADICSQAERRKSGDLEELNALSEKGSHILTEIEIITSDLQHLESNNQDCQLFIQIIKSKDKLYNLSAAVNQEENSFTVSEYSFVPQPEIQTILEGKLAIGHLNNYNFTPSACLHNEFILSPRTPRDQVEDPKQVHASHVRDISVKTGNVRSLFDCLIRSSTLIPDNTLVLIDEYFTKVKMLNLDSDIVVSELSVKSKPYAVTTVNDEEVALTLPDDEVILFVKVTSVLKRGRTVPAGGECFGIAYSSGKLFTSFCNPGRIVIMSLDGTAEMTIANDIDGICFFKRPRHIAMSPDCETIYVSDIGDTSVKGIALNGTLKHAYKDKKWNELGGIAVDKFGQIIVCDQKLKQLHLLSPDGKKLKVLVDKLPWVRSVTYCGKSQRLYVGMNRNVIKVFQML